MMLPLSLEQCLREEMRIEMTHFYRRFRLFDTQFRIIAIEHLGKLKKKSLDIKGGNSTFDDINSLYYENGNNEQNDFLQVMFDCFKEFALHDGLELQKSLYSHTNRGGDDWFPLTIIKQPVTEYPELEPTIVLYRGCHKRELELKPPRQSWTKSIDVAKAFAFTHFHSLDSSERVVIKALFKKEDVFWVRNGEQEVVINPTANLQEATIALNHKDFSQEAMI